MEAFSFHHIGSMWKQLLPKMEAKKHGYNIVHKMPWVTKVYTFPFPGYILCYIASCGHNSLLDEYRCTQMDIVPMYMPA